MIRPPLDLDYARPIMDLEFPSFWDYPSGLGGQVYARLVINPHGVRPFCGLIQFSALDVWTDTLNIEYLWGLIFVGSIHIVGRSNN